MKLHTNEPVTEAAFFESVNLQAGEEAFVAGAVMRSGQVLTASRVHRPAEDEVELLCMSPDGRAVSLKARQGSSEIFASSASLAG